MRNGNPPSDWLLQLWMRPPCASRARQPAIAPSAREAAKNQKPLHASASSTITASGSAIFQGRRRVPGAGCGAGFLTVNPWSSDIASPRPDCYANGAQDNKAQRSPPDVRSRRILGLRLRFADLAAGL